MSAAVRRSIRLAAVLLFATATAHAADVVVAQVAPLSGVLASTGRQMVVGGRIYFEQVNQQGGIHGEKIRHVVLDDSYQTAETVRLTKEAVDKEGAVVLFGFAGTANIGELLNQKVLEQAGVALVAPYTGGEPLRKPFNPWIFHVRAGYADEAEHIVDQLTTTGTTRIAVLYQDDAFGQAGLAGVEAALARRGLKLAASASYPRNTDQVDEAVKIIRTADPQGVVMISINRPTAAFAKKFREAGGTASLFNISVVDPAELVKLAGLSNVRGLGISQVMPYPYSPMLPVIKEYQTLLKKFAPNEAVNYTSFEEFVGAKIVVEALRRAGPAPTRAKVIRSLQSLRDYDLGGLVISFSADNRIGSRYVDLTVIGQSGRLLH